MNKIAITSIAYISSEGTGFSTFLSQVRKKSVGYKIENYDPQNFMAEELLFLNKSSIMFCNLALQCLKERNIIEQIEDKSERIGIYNGSELANLEDVITFYQDILNFGPDNVSPMSVPRKEINFSAGTLAIKLKIMGPNISICAGRCSSLQTIEIARLHILQSIIDYGLVATTETSSIYHEALREEDNINENYFFSGECGVGILLEGIRDIDFTKNCFAFIDAVSSGFKLQHEKVENLVLRVIDNLKSQVGENLFNIDLVIIASGGYFIDFFAFDILINQYLNKKVQVIFPELILGVCDSAGGLLGILYAIGLMKEKIDYLPMIDREIKTEKSYKNILICCLDKEDYCATVLISK
jgi:3-oxoacyl-[acyl-carrier-protein] synthase II